MGNSTYPPLNKYMNDMFHVPPSPLSILSCVPWTHLPMWIPISQAMGSGRSSATVSPRPSGRWWSLPSGSQALATSPNTTRSACSRLVPLRWRLTYSILKPFYCIVFLCLPSLGSSFLLLSSTPYPLSHMYVNENSIKNKLIWLMEMQLIQPNVPSVCCHFIRC